MKVTVSATALSEALSLAGKAVGTGKELPSLAHVLVEAHPDGGVTLTGTDRRLRTWRTVPATVGRAGVVALPPRVLGGFLDAIPDDGVVELAVDARYKAVLSCGPTTVRVAGLDPEGFPPAPTGQPTAELSIAAADLRRLVDGSAFAADPKPDSTAYKECVHVATRGGRLVFEATDGLRLARHALPIDGEPALDLLVPAGSLRTAVGMVAAGKATVGLIATPTHLLLESEAGRAALATVEATFPDADRIIPKDPASRVVANRAALDRALKLAGHVEKAAVGYRVDLDASAGIIKLSASDRSADHEARTEVAIDLSGEPVALVLTATHLVQAIDALDAYEAVEIAVTSPRHPVVVRGVGDEDGAQVNVLMPILAATS